MSVFKVGDRVRRIAFEFEDMPIDSEWIVSRTYGELSVELEGHGEKAFFVDRFELVESAPFKPEPTRAIIPSRLVPSIRAFAASRECSFDAAVEMLIDAGFRYGYPDDPSDLKEGTI
jgi:hypothetical protein